MPYFTFTVTQEDYIFTATLSAPAQLTMEENPQITTVTNVISTVTISNITQPVTVSGSGTGQNFNQNLNTTDNVAFASVTTPDIYGTAGQPVNFPTGVNIANVGSTFVGGLDFGEIYTTVTNQINLLQIFTVIDMGSVIYPSPYTLDFGTI